MIVVVVVVFTVSLLLFCVVVVVFAIVLLFSLVRLGGEGFKITPQLFAVAHCVLPA